MALIADSNLFIFQPFNSFQQVSYGKAAFADCFDQLWEFPKRNLLSLELMQVDRRNAAEGLPSRNVAGHQRLGRDLSVVANVYVIADGCLTSHNDMMTQSG